MKKFVLVIFILLNNIFNSSAQIYLNAFIDFIWGEWKPISSEIVIDGNYDGFIIYSKKEGPWNYRFKFTIDDMTFPSKKQRKKDIKDGKWYEFKGTVEYYISDDYLNAYSMFKENSGPYFLPAKLKNGRPTKKVIKEAKIGIEAFKDLPSKYRISYEFVGPIPLVTLGIILKGGSFSNVKFK